MRAGVLVHARRHACTRACTPPPYTPTAMQSVPSRGGSVHNDGHEQQHLHMLLLRPQVVPSFSLSCGFVFLL